jgi:PAS domain S-box-containing protein
MAAAKSSLERGGALRRRAEKALGKGAKSAPEKLPRKDQELIHELQVYQVELEMQNDELRKAQEEIEKSRSKYVDLFDFAPVGYFTLDEKAVIIEANLTGASLLGVPRQELLKSPFFLFILPEDRALFRSCQKKVIQIPGRQSCELRLKRKASDHLWVNLESIGVEDPGGKLTGVRMAVMDITDRKRSEEALKRSESRLQDLSFKLLNLQEMERKKIANEIHDGLLSDLAGVNFGLEAKIKLLEKENHPVVPDLWKLLNIHQKTMKEARRIMDWLRPSLLDDLGLIPTLNAFCREFQMLYPQIQMKCEMEVREDEIPKSIKVVIFRVVQEAMTNSARHGRGTLAKISLVKRLDRIELFVQDNGRGFDLEHCKKGVGLESMRERVEFSGGEFQIKSILGRGTTIRAFWRSS